MFRKLLYFDNTPTPPFNTTTSTTTTIYTSLESTLYFQFQLPTHPLQLILRHTLFHMNTTLTLAPSPSTPCKPSGLIFIHFIDGSHPISDFSDEPKGTQDKYNQQHQAEQN